MKASSYNVYHWHNEGFDVPNSAELLARGSDFPNQAFRYGNNIYGIQFHPEVTPNIFKRWIGEAGHMLQHPGADPAIVSFANVKLLLPSPDRKFRH